MKVKGGVIKISIHWWIGCFGDFFLAILLFFCDFYFFCDFFCFVFGGGEGGG